VRPQHGFRQQEAADDGIKTTHEDTKPFLSSPDHIHMAMSPYGLRLTPHILL